MEYMYEKKKSHIRKKRNLNWRLKRQTHTKLLFKINNV